MISTKWPSVEAGMLAVIIVVSLFSFAFLTSEHKISWDSSGNQITGTMVKVAEIDFSQRLIKDIGYLAEINLEMVGRW